ncbi:PRE_C2HC domain-containing protein [Trichonephila clavata]|uniref:PRE_C2HC domain-containing protein n=1 Tax=Trichonephila clavata TaxID=2740835 RepID=A0A8X6HMH9_TRICU|nr:PRE_C2HC domain-containing protein [Trichonephila clavata]
MAPVSLENRFNFPSNEIDAEFPALPATQPTLTTNTNNTAAVQHPQAGVTTLSSQNTHHIPTVPITNQGSHTGVTPSSPQPANTPKPKLPPPIMLKITDSYREHISTISQFYSGIRTKTTGEFIKLYTNTDEEHDTLVDLLEKLGYQHYVITPKSNRPIKVVIKRLPKNTKCTEIKDDLVLLGLNPEKVIQLIGRKTKQPLPVYSITLPRNIHNLKIFNLKTIGYMSIRVEGFESKGV